MIKILKQEFKEKILTKFKEEIFLWLKIFLVIALLISWFLFWRIYENSNLLNFLWNSSDNKNDNYTLIEIEKISDKWIKWKINFWSLKILKDWKKISLDAGKFFIEK